MLLSAGVLCTSCEDWLSTGTITEIEGPDMMESADGFKSALTGVYLTMGEAEVYGGNLTFEFQDRFAYPYTVKSWYTDFASLGYEATRIQTIINNIWAKEYNIIANINYALRYLKEDNGVLDPVTYSIIKGELLGLRVFAHFDLLRLYGLGNWPSRADIAGKRTIPYVTELSKDIPRQYTYGEIFKAMEDDLNAAAECLKQDPIYKENKGRDYSEINTDGFLSNRTLRMNYYAVRALQARLYLWEGSSESLRKAEIAAQDVIDNAGCQWADLNTLTAPREENRDKTFTTEYVFGLYVYNLNDLTTDATSGNPDSNTSLLLESTYVEDGIFLTTVYDDEWNPSQGEDASDVRYARLLLPSSGYYYPIKLKQVSTDRLYDYYQRIPLIRLPEMYYIKAECLAKAGDNPGALDQLDIVRQHRGLSSELDDSKDAMEELTKEYMKEFISEGQFFFYCKRRGIENISDSNGTNFVTLSDQTYLVPYPKAETDNNRIQDR